MIAMREQYFELFDWLERERTVEPRAFFSRLQAAYGIAHVFYVDAVPSLRSTQFHRLHHTLAARDHEALRTVEAGALHASLRFVLTSVRPVEHETLRRLQPGAALLFQRAEALGLSPQGISYPLLSPACRAAALSISVPLPPAEAAAFLRFYGRDIHTLSALFHAAMIEAERPAAAAPDIAITPREREVLRWSAAGKSYWEIAMILGITERTVRFFMSNARQKLDVVSNTQAVAEAVWRGLIPHV